MAETKPKLNLYSYLNVIIGKENMTEEHEQNFDKLYNKWMFNKIISNDIQLVGLCDKLSRFTELPDRVHFRCIQLYYKEKYGSRKIYIPYAKKDSVSEDIQLISDRYNVNYQDAANYLDMISDDELNDLREAKKEIDKSINTKVEKIKQTKRK